MKKDGEKEEEEDNHPEMKKFRKLATALGESLEHVCNLQVQYPPVLGILDILVRIRIRGSTNPYRWLRDPNPDLAIFVSDLLDSN